MSSSAIVALAVIGMGTGAARSQDQDSVSRAEALLKRIDDALRSASSLSARFVIVDASPKPFRDLRQTGTVTMVKPGSFRIEIARARRPRASDPWADTGNNTLRVGDSSHQYSVFFHPHSTQVRETAKGGAAQLTELPLLGGFFGEDRSLYAVFEAAKAEGSLRQVQVTDAGVSFVANGVERRVEIDPKGLPVRLVEKKEGSDAIRTFELDSTRIDKAVNPSVFAYAPPPDALPYAQGERAEALETGTEAPDFEITDSKGQTVRLHDLRGKVVVLKFWATWCWPCNQSMPETEALAAKYAPEGVVTLAVAIKDSRKGFDAWVAKHPEFGHVRFAFEDPLRPNASKGFRVAATPTVFIIAKDGRIEREFAGFSGRNEALDEAVRNATTQKRQLARNGDAGLG